jgi:outer membrane receptor protein involved in Fe transport
MQNTHRLSGLFAFLVCLPALAAGLEQWRGEPLVDLLDAVSEQGLRVIYSSALVADDFIVTDEPDLSDPVEGLKSALRPFGLALESGPAASWLVVRAEAAVDDAVVAIIEHTEPPLPEIIVTSSLHRIGSLQTSAPRFLDRELASRIPAAAEEVVRMTARLPGTASGGISVRNHVRGGEANEVLFLLDGLRLYEPFHLKDFQAVATTINPNAIDGMDFYSGAYPARFGDRMSGVIDMHLREPDKPIETELALSFFNASVLSMGRFGGGEKGDWLVAARRGNLDLIADIINPDIGSPDYQDYIVHGGWEFGPRTKLSANFMLSKDKLLLADVDRGENANANYENQVFWLKWQADWSSRLHSDTIFSLSDISNERRGTLLLPGIVTGALDEQHEFRSYGLKQDWTFTPSSKWMLLFGVDAKRLDSKYRFNSIKAVTPPFDGILDNEALLVRNSNLSPEGAQYGAHVELRLQISPALVVDAGIRRDYQSYTTANDDSQTSPRLSLLYRLGKTTEFRLGWGQYSQAQEINELQVSDGIESYFPAQRAEHVVANLAHNVAGKIDIELSYYRKSFRTVRPRYENVFNTLTLLPEIQFDRVQIDAASAQAEGAELQIRRGSSEDNLFWWLGYSWSEVRDETSDGKVLRSWDQAHTVKAGISWRWGPWDFSAAAEAHRGWPKTELIAETIVDAGGMEILQLTTTPRNEGRYSNFNTLDVRVSRDFDLRHGELTAFLEISNVYDRANPCCTEYSLGGTPSGGPALLAKETHWLPLLPSLGVVWRF